MPVLRNVLWSRCWPWPRSGFTLRRRRCRLAGRSKGWTHCQRQARQLSIRETWIWCDVSLLCSRGDVFEKTFSCATRALARAENLHVISELIEGDPGPVEQSSAFVLHGEVLLQDCQVSTRTVPRVYTRACRCTMYLISTSPAEPQLEQSARLAALKQHSHDLGAEKQARRLALQAAVSQEPAHKS